MSLCLGCLHPVLTDVGTPYTLFTLPLSASLYSLRASLFLTRAPAPPLSRVPRRVLSLNNNQLTTLPAIVFNGLTNLW